MQSSMIIEFQRCWLWLSQCKKSWLNWKVLSQDFEYSVLCSLLRTLLLTVIDHLHSMILVV